MESLPYNTMITTEPVTSLDKRELSPYRTLRRPLEHFRDRIFVAEGEKVVRRLLNSDLEVVSILCTNEWYDKISRDLGRRNLIVYLGTKELVETIVGYNLHQGIMAIGKVPAGQPLDAFLTNNQNIFLAALDGLVNAENVGVIVRNCAAFGIDGILVGETSSSPYLRRAVRNSMGAVFTLPVFHVDNLADTITGLLRPHGVFTIAAHPEGRRQFQDLKPLHRACVVFGNEGAGISEQVLNACDEQVGIHMKHGTDSLNVASASAVFLHELARLTSIDQTHKS